MGRSASRGSRENEKRKMVKEALLAFLVGLLLLVLKEGCDRFGPPPPTPIPTPTPTAMRPPPPTMAPTLTPTTVALPTLALSTPSPEDSDCPDRPDQTRGAPFLYRVRRGDTVSWLSDCFNVSQDALMESNWIDDPTKMYEDTYIVIPPPASRGGPESPQTMLQDQERAAIDAFNAMIADMFVQWPHEPDVSSADQYGGGEAVQSALLWVHSVLQSYNPTSVLSATYDWNLPPLVADPDFGWQPWQRGAYGTIRWRIQLQFNEGSHAELPLYQSVHYGLGTLQTSPEVARFETFTCRYPSMTAMTNQGD